MSRVEHTLTVSQPEMFALACKLPGPLEFRAVHRVKGTTLAFTVNQPYAFIGRASQMPVRLEDPSVSQCHAYIQVIGGVPYCIDLGSRTGVVWDDGSQGAGWVSSGRTIQIGPYDVQIGEAGTERTTGTPRLEPIDADHTRDEALPPVSLEVHAAGTSAGTYFPLERSITLIGRHPSCHLRFMEDTVSYFHCAIVNTPDGVWCIDFFSREGTVLNGRSTRLARLREADLVELGKVSVVLRSAAPVAPPVSLNGTTGLQRIESPTPAPQRMADTMALAFAPVREMMEQYQQCLVSLVRVIGTIQQEHATVMCEQMRLTQEIVRELRELRSEVKPPVAAAPPTAAPIDLKPAAPDLPSPPAPRPVSKAHPGAEQSAPTDVHNWFLERMAELGQPLPSAKK